jgi:hypothetical protein
MRRMQEEVMRPLILLERTGSSEMEAELQSIKLLLNPFDKDLIEKRVRCSLPRPLLDILHVPLRLPNPPCSALPPRSVLL